MKKKEQNATWADRLAGYTAEKQSLNHLGLSSAEYDKRVRALERKWRV